MLVYILPIAYRLYYAKLSILNERKNRYDFDKCPWIATIFDLSKHISMQIIWSLPASLYIYGTNLLGCSLSVEVLKGKGDKLTKFFFSKMFCTIFRGGCDNAAWKVYKQKKKISNFYGGRAAVNNINRPRTGNFLNTILIFAEKSKRIFTF